MAILHRVIVWSWSLSGRGDEVEQAQSLLTPEEQARASRFVNPIHGARFTAGRAALRNLLAAHLGADPAELRFAENEYGKPRLLGAPLYFSLTHSEDEAALAISETLEIGLDLERIRELEHLDLARRYFSAREIAAIEAESGAEQELAFFKTWTLKEAVVKAIGTGVSTPLAEFSVSFASPPSLIIAPPNSPPPDQWRLYWIDAAPGCVCALAAPGAAAGAEITQRTY